MPRAVRVGDPALLPPELAGGVHQLLAPGDLRRRLARIETGPEARQIVFSKDARALRGRRRRLDREGAGSRVDHLQHRGARADRPQLRLGQARPAFHVANLGHQGTETAEVPGQLAEAGERLARARPHFPDLAAGRGNRAQRLARAPNRAHESLSRTGMEGRLRKQTSGPGQVHLLLERATLGADQRRANRLGLACESLQLGPDTAQRHRDQARRNRGPAHAPDAEDGGRSR